MNELRDWDLLPEETKQANPHCMFCNRPMSFEFLRSWDNGWQENSWACGNPKCFRNVQVIIQFKV